MKLTQVVTAIAKFLSHPARGAWIEISVPKGKIYATAVAPRKGCVD